MSGATWRWALLALDGITPHAGPARTRQLLLPREFRLRFSDYTGR